MQPELCPKQLNIQTRVANLRSEVQLDVSDPLLETTG
jgi:hypothetical protein